MCAELFEAQQLCANHNELVFARAPARHKKQLCVCGHHGIVACNAGLAYDFGPSCEQGTLFQTCKEAV